MDLTSFYLRTFLGATPFASNDLDSLADKMGVSHLLSRDRRDRYFITAAKGISAANLGRKIVFGRHYYERLSGDERLAVSAHEMAHVRDADNERLKISLTSLGLSLIFTLVASLASHSILLTECVFCASLLSVMSILSARDAERSKLREMRCDNIAVSFVGGDAMLSSIRLAQSMLAQKSQHRRRSLWSRKKKESDTFDPTVEERAIAIMACATEIQRNEGGGQEPIPKID